MYALYDEALPWNINILKFAGTHNPVTDTPVDKVSHYDKGQHHTYHGAPSFQLTLNINSQIATQMFVGIVTLEIGFTGINVSFAPVIEIFLNPIVGHDVTSMGCCMIETFCVLVETNIGQLEKKAM